MTANSGRGARGRKLVVLAVLLAALVPAAILAWKTRHFEHLGYFHDDGMYWIGGKSLAEGHGYRILSLPDTPFQTKYPPLYPLLLALVWKVFPAFPGNLPWAMLVTWLTLPALVVVNLRLLESWGCSRPNAMLACAWMALNPYVVLFSVSLMPELLMSALLAGCFLAAQAAAGRDSGRLALAAGVLGAAAYLTKSTALPLLVAGPIWFTLRRKFRLGLWFLVPLLAAAILWNGWSARHMGPSSDSVSIYYTSYLGDYLHDLRPAEWLTFLWRNIPIFLASIGNLLIPDVAEFPFLGRYFSQLLALFAMAGILRQIRRDGGGLPHWFAAGFSALLLVWQYPPNERFLIPLLPLIAFGAMTELRHVAELVRAVWRSGLTGQRVAAGLFALLLVTVGLWAGSMVAAGHTMLLPGVAARYHRQSDSNRQVYRWINQNLPRGETFLTYYDAPAFLYTGHAAIRPPNFPKQYYRQDKQAVRRALAALPEFARRRDIHYLLLSEVNPDLDPFVKEIAGGRTLASDPAYRLRFQPPRAAIYEIAAPLPYKQPVAEPL